MQFIARKPGGLVEITEKERKRERICIFLLHAYIFGMTDLREKSLQTRATLTKPPDVISLLEAKASVRSDESIEMCARMIGNESLGCAQNAPLES